MIKNIKLLAALITICFFGNKAFSQSDTLVYWNFADSNQIVDHAIAANNSSIIKRQNGFAGTYIYETGVTNKCIRTATWSAGTGTKYWMIGFTSKTGIGTGYSSLKLSSRQKSTDAGPRDFRVEYSLDTLTWYAVAGSDIKSLNDNFISGTISLLNLPAACDTQQNVYLRWVMTSDSNALGTGLATSGYNRMDDILVVGQLYPPPPDTLAPFVTNVLAKTTDTVEVTFNEALNSVSAQNPSNYTFSVHAVCDQSVLIAADKVRLHLSTPLHINVPDTLIVNNIADLSGNVMSSAQKIPVIYMVIDTIVYWGFADSNQVADKGIAVNLTKTFNRQNSFTGAYSYDPGVTDKCLRTSSWATGTGTKYWLAEFSSKTGPDAGYISLKFFSRQKSTNSGPRDFRVDYSFDTITWLPIAGSNIKSLNDNFVSGTINGLSLPSACDKKDKVFLRWVMTSDSNAQGTGLATTGYNRIDDVLVCGLYSPDNIPPIIMSVKTVLCNKVKIVYNELVDPVSALDTANYSFKSGKIDSIAQFGLTHDTVWVYIKGTFTPGVTDTIFIKNIADTAGNKMTGTKAFGITCSMAGIQENDGSANTISVYPNPFNDNVSVMVNTLTETTPIEILIYNTLGKLIWRSLKGLGVMSQSIDLSGFNAGLYYMVININDVAARIEKLVKTN